MVPLAELVRKASTHRYLSVDAVTEHIAGEMRLILRSDKGKAGVFCRACLDLPSAACPTFHGARQVYARMQEGLTLPTTRRRIARPCWTSTAFESTSCAYSRACTSRQRWRGCRGLMRANRRSRRSALIGRWLGCVRVLSAPKGTLGT